MSSAHVTNRTLFVLSVVRRIAPSSSVFARSIFCVCIGEREVKSMLEDNGQSFFADKKWDTLAIHVADDCVRMNTLMYV